MSHAMRFLVLGGVTVVLAGCSDAAPTSPAAAENAPAPAADATNNPHSLPLTFFNCSPGPTTYQVIAFIGWEVKVVGSNSIYIILTQSYTDATGTHVLHDAKADPPGQQLVTCHYIGPETGRDYTNVGFFTSGG